MHACTSVCGAEWGMVSSGVFQFTFFEFFSPLLSQEAACGVEEAVDHCEMLVEWARQRGRCLVTNWQQLKAGIQVASLPFSACKQAKVREVGG